MYNACEWGNYCRVQDSGIESGRQVGRRSIVTYAAIAVRPDSDVFTTQQLADRLVGVPFYFGTHYLALHMLEGFLPRERIRVCSAPMGSRFRLDSMMSGEIEATTLTEPYITLAEKKGCRILTAAFYHGTESRLAQGRRGRPMRGSTARFARRFAGSTPTRAGICAISSTTTAPTRKSRR